MKTIEALFDPRPYQRVAMRKFLLEDKKRMLLLWPRRAGKDHLSINLVWMKAIQEPGLYLYMLPVISQAASVIWNGRGKNGIAFMDYLPKEIVAKVNHSSMSVYLINGSIIRVTGSNAYESLIGSNPRLVIYSEIQNSDLRSWDYLRPILAENGGSCIMIGTAKGYNHLYELYTNNLDNPEWFVQKLTVDDIVLDDGSPVITQEAIEEERRSGMSESLIQQEFYNSFTAAIVGAYYAQELDLMKQAGRICSFNIDPNLPVHVSFDLGISDATSVCLMQIHPNKDVKVIYHFEETGQELSYYTYKLHELKERLGFKRFGTVYLPHDVRQRSLSTGQTRLVTLQKSGLSNLRIVGNHKIIDRIQCVRSMLPRVSLHKDNCKTLIRALSEYRANYDEKNKVSRGPVHDKFSHAADSFGYFCVGHLETNEPAAYSLQRKYASFQP